MIHEEDLTKEQNVKNYFLTHIQKSNFHEKVHL